MAGIGFQLKKLFRHNGYLNNLRAYGYTAFITVGPMVLCMLLVVIIQQLLINKQAPVEERQLFLSAIQYGFVFSQLATSGFIMILYRFVADRIYLKEYDEILASLQGVVGVCLLIGGTVGSIFYFQAPLKPGFKLAAYLLYVELIVIWLQNVYISALKDYLRLVKCFFAGVATSVAIALLFLEVFSWNNAMAMVVAVDIGFFIMIILFMRQIVFYFRTHNQNYLEFLTYLDKYPSLFFIGFFYTLGLFIHNFIYWGSKFQVVVKDTYITAPFYDVPVFYALLSIIPSMVFFVVSVETAFYEKYKSYYSSILQGGSWQDIKRARQEMYQALVLEMSHIMELQLFFSITSMAIGMLFLPRIGLNPVQVKTFYMLVLGAFCCIVLYLVTLLLLYFDDRKGTLFVMTVFLFTNTVLTYLLVNSPSYGLSYFTASFLGMVAAFARLYYYLENIDYYTFCSQPVVLKEQKAGVFTKLVHRLRDSF